MLCQILRAHLVNNTMLGKLSDSYWLVQSPNFRCHPSQRAILQNNPRVKAALFEARIAGIHLDCKKRLGPSATTGQAFDHVDAWLRSLLEPEAKRAINQLEMIGTIDPQEASMMLSVKTGEGSAPSNIMSVMTPPTQMKSIWSPNGQVGRSKDRIFDMGNDCKLVIKGSKRSHEVEMDDASMSDPSPGTIDGLAAGSLLQLNEYVRDVLRAAPPTWETRQVGEQLWGMTGTVVSCSGRKWSVTHVSSPFGL